MKVAAVNARALSLSDMWPARMPPTTPPTSNNVDNVPDVESDKCLPSITAWLRKYHVSIMQDKVTVIAICLNLRIGIRQEKVASSFIIHGDMLYHVRI